MSIPLPGTYRLRSVAFPNQLFDLNGGSADVGTPVIGQANNYDSQNMLWTLQVVDLDGLVRLINVASGTFAQQADASVVGGNNPTLFRIVPRPNLGEYAIQTPAGELACSLTDNVNGTQVILQAAAGNEPSKGWIFCPV